MGRFKTLLADVIASGCTEACDEDEKTIRRIFCGASLFVGIAGPIWGAMYIAFDELGPGLIPLIYGFITYASFAQLRRSDSWNWFRLSQLFLIFVLPFSLMWSLGGFIPGSAVMIWAILAPIGALWGGQSREAAAWISAFLIASVASGLVDPLLRESNNLPDGLVTIFFVMNIGMVCGVLAALIAFYVRQMDSLIDVMRRNRELESAYLAQEVSLRQSDKLATLGRLSAGMAHELNNPAAAAQQASKQLGDLLQSARLRTVERAGLDLNDAEQLALESFSERVSDTVGKPQVSDPLERSDREAELQEVLEEIGVAEPWDVAPALASLGMDASEVAHMRTRLRPEKLVDVLTLISVRYTRQHLIGGLDESTTRIIDLVGALKTYTYLDQAPRQLIDVHEGLDSTLVMLQHQLKGGVEVRRSYGEGVVAIEANGTELNQVWTNILDNAIDAMHGEGTIEIATMFDGAYVSVEISDDGPGIHPEILETIFDPFVTSKPPGEGTGLGLNIAHNIVTEKHGGRIAVTSTDAGARFRVDLPVALPDIEVPPEQQPTTHEESAVT
ncbi:MAG: sensor histidine kinase [Acidimicrobiales bacterium]